LLGRHGECDPAPALLVFGDVHVEGAGCGDRVADPEIVDDSDFILVKNRDFPNLAIAFGLQVEGGVRATAGGDGSFGEGTDKASDQNDSHLCGSEKEKKPRATIAPRAGQAKCSALRPFGVILEITLGITHIKLIDTKEKSYETNH
jgi:hypothetical protein